MAYQRVNPQDYYPPPPTDAYGHATYMRNGGVPTDPAVLASALAAANAENARREAADRAATDRATQARTADQSRRDAAQARQDALAAEERARNNQLSDRAHAEGLLGIGGTGSMAALGGVASGGVGGTGTTVLPGTGGSAPGGGVSAAPAMQTMEDTTAADTAARTSAKEGAGLRLSASMRGLDAAMGARGIRGSGIQANEAEKLFAGSASDESAANTDILNRQAARRADIGNRNQDATNQWANANLSASTQLSMSAADRLAAGENQLRSLLWNYAMRY
jgi:hypothetical protein